MRALSAEQWRRVTDKVISIEQAYVVTTKHASCVDFIGSKKYMNKDEFFLRNRINDMMGNICIVGRPDFDAGETMAGR